MAPAPHILRRIFAAAAAVAVLVAAGFYLRGIIKSQKPLAHLPKQIPENIARSGAGFTYSQSEGGKTLFTIRAANFQQFKEPGHPEGGKAELHDVSIVVYDRNNNSSDQIYGSDFLYDPETGDMSANGQVQIDLEASASVSASAGQQPAPETRNLIHVSTSGLTFNRKSGIAHTSQKIEFRFPGAKGSAIGATYNSHESVLTLGSAVRVVTTEKQKATITGQSASISKDPRQIVLHTARVEQPERTLSSDQVKILLRENSTVQRVEGEGNLRAEAPGAKGFELTASEGKLLLVGNNQPQSATISGNVNFARRGDSPANGRAENIALQFGAKGQIRHAQASGQVDLTQGIPGKSQELRSAAVDLSVRNGRQLQKAVTSQGPAEMILTRQSATNTITAGGFEADFSPDNRLRSLVGTPDARIVSETPGQPKRTASARQLTAAFRPDGQIATADLAGNFHYQEGQRTATADQAHYIVATETYSLQGSPRVQESGVSLSADTLELNRKTGSAVGKGHVKTTYNDLKPQPGGGMLASSAPIHVTGTSVTASQATASAKYTAARLWQGPNIVEAPSLTFNKTDRSLRAEGNQAGRVSTVFLQGESNGKTTPVTVAADRLTYVDSERRATFSGKVEVHAEDAVMNANTAQVLLRPGGTQPGSASGQLDRIVAEGDIRIQERDRRGQGSRLVYVAQEQKFVLTGSEGHLPSIFDAEHGQISGNSLTFFTQGDRVLVGSGDSAPAGSQKQESRRE
jgi:lipopolysaccharide export system protein LptA